MTAPASTASAGQLVDGYELVARRSDHGLGDVWLAQRPHQAAERAVVKLISPLSGDGAVAPRAFEELLKKLTRITSPNLVTVRGGGVHQRWLYVLTEAIEGRSLDDWLHGHRDSDHRPPPGVVLHVFDSLCGALQGAHRQGVVHGALSPATVMLKALSPGAYHAWVLDLGLASWIREAAAQAALEAPSPVYQSPEETTGDALTPRSDVFSLALLLTEMLTLTATPGCTPRETLARYVQRDHRRLVEHLRPLRDDVHEDFWNALVGALHPDPSQRPENALQLKNRIRAAAQNAGLWRDVPEHVAEPPAPKAVRQATLPPSRREAPAAPEGWQHAERARVDPLAAARSTRGRFTTALPPAAPRRTNTSPGALNTPTPAPAPTPSPTPAPMPYTSPPPPAMPVSYAPVATLPDTGMSSPAEVPHAAFSFADPVDADGTERRPSLLESDTTATIQPRVSRASGAPARASGAPGRSRSPTRAVQEDARSAFMTLQAGRTASLGADVAPLDASPMATLQAKRLTADDLRAAGVAVPADYDAPARPPVNPADFEAEETLKPVRASVPSAPAPAPVAFAPVSEPVSQTKLVALPPMEGDPSQTLVARGPRPATMPPPAPHAMSPAPGVVYGAAPQPGPVHGVAPFTLQPLDAPRSSSSGTARWLVPVILVVTAVVAATAFLLAATRS